MPTTQYEDHPKAAIFPLLSDDELRELAEDIKKNGVEVPIVIYEGKILDGRNRYRAAQMVGATVPTHFYTGDTPTDHVISLNLKRRQLTPGQKAAAAVAALPHLEEEARKRQATSSGGAAPQLVASLPQADKSKSRDKAAELTGASPRYVQDAKKLSEEAPDLYNEVRAGTKTIPKAKAELAERRNDPLKGVQLTPEQEKRIEEAEKDSETLWTLKTYWRKATKKDRSAFREWITQQ